MRMQGMSTVRKSALSIDDLQQVTSFYKNLTFHNDKLFVTMLLTGFFGLGELSFSDNKLLHNWKKVICHNTVKISSDQYKFSLPGHKAN
jgi:hypothetical protein